MSASMVSLQQMMEKLLLHLPKSGKLPVSDDGPSIVMLEEEEDSGDRRPTDHETPPPFTPPEPPLTDSLFSLPKVELPLFDGIGSRGWITKAELYFLVHKTSSAQKLNLVQMCMDGTALNWFTNLLYKHPNTDWYQFRNKMMVRLSGTRFLNAFEALGSLYQDGDVEDYIEQFEALSALIPTQSEEQSIRLFLRGLHPDIRNWVRTLNPLTCDNAMDTARHVESATRTMDEEPGPEGGRVHSHPGGILNPGEMVSYGQAQNLVGPLIISTQFLSPSLSTVQHLIHQGVVLAQTIFILIELQTFDTLLSSNGKTEGRKGCVFLADNATLPNISVQMARCESCCWLMVNDWMMMARSFDQTELKMASEFRLEDKPAL